MTAPTPTGPVSDGGLGEALRDRYAFLRDVVAEMERTVPYASALVGRSDGVRLTLRDGDQAAEQVDPRAGVVLSAWDGRGFREASTNATDPDGVRRLARELVERVRAERPGRDSAEATGIDPGPQGEGHFATRVERDPDELGLGDKLAMVEALRRRVRALDPRAVQALCTYADQAQQRVFVSRTRFVSQRVRRTHLSATLVVSDGSQTRWHSSRRGGTGGLEVAEIGEEELDELAAGAARMLAAGPCPPGTYDVVTDPDVSGVLAHEAFGHGVETDMFLKGRARGADYLGRRVGSGLVNIVDDPSVPAAYGSYFFDDEGQPATPTEIIRDGVLRRGITDLYSSARLTIPRSANGRRESVHHKAYPRMSNTFFTPGPHRDLELLESLEHGLFVRSAINGMEDPKGWGMQILAGYAEEYRHGRPTGTVYTPISMTGYVPDLLADVSMVSDRVEHTPGTCGKGWKELVPVSSGGPMLRTRCRIA